MLTKLKRIFGPSTPPLKTKLVVVDEYDEEIPRYPPFAKGLPVAPIDKVLLTQDELIQRIRNALGFNKEECKSLILPVIKKYAEFVHLLPASEAHHHRGAGGLFRHGLEVAFWAAQASESVIFSMEGSPRDRRNNEPRWRLASCFAGLLHDVGKPLSDVSVTDKGGSVTWNPYSNTLYGWAVDNKIDRYFLRWRDSRHKRHEQFSVLTIERIIPPNVLQFLSESGPEILEAMLEAIAGTSTNQPVTRLMLKADQESVARDLKQSRLSVDEFSYGVPVERYVFDAIRRLVKTGRWKINEPGAKVWNLHQGVFITWRQLGDLYELVEKDNIPGIPRDPDTLADILIERGFAIPNKVQGKNGESAHYRYWDVCPEIIQQGQPAGTIKLLGLRLESHELVFTNEPPTPVKGVVIGEEAEVEIKFVDIESNAASDEGASDEGASDTDASENDYGFVDFEMVHEIVANSPEVDDESPLDGLLKNDIDPETIEGALGEAEVVRTEQNQFVQTEQTASDPVDTVVSVTSTKNESINVSCLFPSKAEKNIPGSKGKKQPAPLTSENPDTKPQENNRSVEADCAAKDELVSYLNSLPLDAKNILEKAILPVLIGEKLLGEVLYIFEGQVSIIYPEGAESLGCGSASEVLACLWSADLIQGDPVMPMKKIQNFKGVKGLALKASTSSLLIAALDELATGEVEVKQVIMEGRKSKKQKRKPSKEDRTESTKGNSGQAKQNSMPFNQSLKQESLTDTNVNSIETKPVKEIFIPEIDEDALLLRGQGKMTADFDDIKPKVITVSSAIKLLKEMILKREGKWIVSAVTKEGDCLVTSGKSLDVIAGEYNDISKHSLRAHLKRGQASPPLMYKQGKLHLFLKEGN
ncbi:MobH family relaxase [Vibrio casei]|uniref:Conjugal transfer protein TraI n=1 Tax=Vibrio casei TaxID=673372 RepID=A0A368LG18_9VIBR|nr:MobH family relaxase [Vibrio casei]RCS68663.1 conjugal transfer protein TraI [Vibrio casei]SJN15989.1 Conjugative transfer protein TraI, relaxase [Vibrio casei]